MKKPLFRFEKSSLKHTISIMDGDGTVYKPFIRWIRLVKKTNKNFVKKINGITYFDLNGLMGDNLIELKYENTSNN